MTLWGPGGREISKDEVARAKAAANAEPREFRGFANAYDAAERHGAWTQGWRPQILSADRAYLPVRDQIVARARDLDRNEPTASAATFRRKNAAVGRGWRLSSHPNATALGIPLDVAQQLGRQIESEFKMYAYGHAFQSDAERKNNFGQQLRMAAHHLFVDGEGCGVAEYALDEETRYATRLRVVDPDRLSNPNGRPDDLIWRGGIEHNPVGVPIRYWFRAAHPADFVGASPLAMTWEPFERFTAWGRPQVFHWFDQERAGQSRGVTRFAAVLKAFRALSRFTDATLQNATVNALFAAFIQSSAGPESVSESLTPADLVDFDLQRNTHYQENPVLLDGDTRIPVLKLGDEIKMATASRDVTAFDAFLRAIIRLIASSLGVTYEEISMDFSQTNYSSARAALIYAMAENDAFQATIEAHLVKPFFVAWLEEAFDRGYIAAPEGAPDFYDAIDAYAEARWIGPKRGYIDPTKEILAAAARIEAGISTLEKECADQGDDWEEIMEQAAREAAKRKELGLQGTAATDEQAIKDTTAKGFAAPEEAADPPATAPEDKRPGDARSPLAQIAAFADTAEHEASLDRRPVAA